MSFKCDEPLHHEDPTSIRELNKREDRTKWEIAMNDEIRSLLENNTWTLTKLPPGRKTVKTKWIFKTKRDNNGKIVRHKARLVAKGYTQRQGVDYNETYAPVVRYTSVRFLVALAVQRGLKIHQMDAITAFLQGTSVKKFTWSSPRDLMTTLGMYASLTGPTGPFTA